SSPPRGPMQPPRPRPPKIPKPVKPRDAGTRVDGGISRDGSVRRDGDVDAGSCDVGLPVQGRLVGTWAWNGELAIVSWNTSDGTFTNKKLGVPGTPPPLPWG